MALWRAASCGQQSKLTVVNVPYYVKFEAAGILRRVQLGVLHRVPSKIYKVMVQASFYWLEKFENCSVKLKN